MARNRKSQSAELRFGPALKALLICVFLGGAGIGYVYQQKLLNKLGEEKRNREKELNQLQFSNAARERQLWELTSQRVLKQRVEALGLDLRLPSPSQIVVLVETPPGVMVASPSGVEAGGGSPLARGVGLEVQEP